MIRSLLFAALLLGTSLVLSGCGIVSHQVHRAANLLRVPVRLSQAPMPEVVQSFDASRA